VVVLLFDVHDVPVQCYHAVDWTASTMSQTKSSP